MKKAHFTELKATRGNQTFVGQGDLDKTLIYLQHLVFCIVWKWLVCAICLLHRSDAKTLWYFFRKLMVAAQNLWRGNGRSRKPTKNKCQQFQTLWKASYSNTKKSENKKEELSTKNWKMNSPYCILMSLTKQCFEPIHQYVCPIY